MKDEKPADETPASSGHKEPLYKSFPNYPSVKAYCERLGITTDEYWDYIWKQCAKYIVLFVMAVILIIIWKAF